jgi:lysozyme family protein
MSEAGCPQESAVARAVRNAEWNTSLEMHIRECAACRETRDAARWMQALAAMPQTQSDELPDARILWLRAQVAARGAAAERVQKVAQWVEIASAMAVCIAAAAWLTWNWAAINGAVSDALEWVTFDASPAFWSGFYTYGPANAPLLFSSALAVIAIITVGVAYPLLARE